MKSQPLFFRFSHCSSTFLAAFALFALAEFFPISARAQFIGQLQPDTRNLILNNTGDDEMLYGVSSQTKLILVGKGKVYFDEKGEVAFATGNHTLKNVDGQGSFIAVVPTVLEAFAIGKSWILGFRADEMKFHWITSDAQAGESVIVVDSLHPHANKVITEGIFQFGDRSPNMVERTVGAEQISLLGNQIVLRGISNMPYTAARTYIRDDSAPTETPSKGTSGAAASCRRQLVITPDGTIAQQDVLVHLTRPMHGESETLLRDVTLVNQYQNKLMFLEIRGAQGKTTGLVLFDKGQSVCFDQSGNPVSGTGRFEIQPGEGGQSVAGWLRATGLSAKGKLLNNATFEFVPRNPLLRSKIPLIAGAIVLVGIAVILCLYRRRQAVPAAA